MMRRLNMGISWNAKYVALVGLGLGVIFLASFVLPMPFVDNVASVFFTESRPAHTLRAKYEVVTPASKAIRILLVAGHEPNFGGAVYLNQYERDMTVLMSQFLAAYLEQDTRFQVIQSRDTEQWNPVLAQHFRMHASSTETFFTEKKDEMASLIEMGLLQEVSGAPHNSAPKDVARRLYGINEWANEQKVDLVVNIHFNDSVRPDVKKPGIYSGFTIYVPERQYSNSSSSKVIATAVLSRLRAVAAVSNLEPESAGIVEDQELISLGRYNTLDAPAMLIEYGYIYERQFDVSDIRRAVIKEMAFKTAVGIQDFFTGRKGEQILPVSTLLPYAWGSEKLMAGESSISALSLQAALRVEGYYPAATSTLNQCPLSGYFDDCTRAALKKFQIDHFVTDEVDILGTTTRNILNRKFSVQQ